MKKAEYSKWIKDNIGCNNGYGECREVCQAMSLEFPELEIRKGVFHSYIWGDRTHWWLRLIEGHSIVDPTARQHPDGSCFPDTIEKYDDLTDMTEKEAIAADKIPIGKCMNCGSEIFASHEYKGTCSQECYETLVGDLS